MDRRTFLKGLAGTAIGGALVTVSFSNRPTPAPDLSLAPIMPTVKTDKDTVTEYVRKVTFDKKLSVVGANVFFASYSTANYETNPEHFQLLDWQDYGTNPIYFVSGDTLQMHYKLRGFQPAKIHLEPVIKYG